MHRHKVMHQSMYILFLFKLYIHVQSCVWNNYLIIYIYIYTVHRDVKLMVPFCLQSLDVVVVNLVDTDAYTPCNKGKKCKMKSNLSINAYINVM